jgi:hypothetical protein
VNFRDVKPSGCASLRRYFGDSVIRRLKPNGVRNITSRTPKQATHLRSSLLEKSTKDRKQMVDTTRRRILRYAPSLVAALAGGKAVDTDELLEPTASADNTSQYRGGPLNQGNKERSDGKSPTEVNRRRTLGTLNNGEFTGPPVTTPGGQYAVPGENVVGLAQSGGKLTELPANGETSNPIFIGETHVSFGDDAIRKFDTTTATQTDKIDYFRGTARGEYAKYDGNSYKSRSNGVEEVDQDTFDSSKLDNIDQTSSGNLLLLDGGDTIIEFATGGNLIKYDVRNERELNSKSVEANAAGISSNGDYIFATSSSETLAYDAETLDRKASADREGAAAGPAPIVENDDVTEIYTGAKNEGIVYSEEFDKNDEEFTSKWEKDMGSFVAVDLVYEDVVLGSTGDKVFALNKETGEELWTMDQVGFVGMPYNDKIPVAGIDGTLYELEMNMTEIGGDCINRRQVSRGQEEQGCHDSAREDAIQDLIDRYGTDRDDWSTKR